MDSELEILKNKLEKLEKYDVIQKELERAEIKHPNFPLNMFEQLAVMQEEAGEVTKAVLQFKFENGKIEDVKEELIQTAASCMRMLQSINNRIEIYSDHNCIYKYCPHPDVCKKNGCVYPKQKNINDN